MEIEPGVELRKSMFFRYRIVYPLKNKDGSINWFNLWTGGSWGNIIMIIAVVAFLCLLVVLYRHDVMQIIDYYNKTCNPLATLQFPVEDVAIPAQSPFG